LSALPGHLGITNTFASEEALLWTCQNIFWQANGAFCDMINSYQKACSQSFHNLPASQNWLFVSIGLGLAVTQHSYIMQTCTDGDSSQTSVQIIRRGL
jgi:hypothetical protein